MSAISKHILELFPHAKIIMDAFCGVAGNTVHFAKDFEQGKSKKKCIE